MSPWRLIVVSHLQLASLIDSRCAGLGAEQDGSHSILQCSPGALSGPSAPLLGVDAHDDAFPRRRRPRRCLSSASLATTMPSVGAAVHDVAFPWCRRPRRCLSTAPSSLMVPFHGAVVRFAPRRRSFDDEGGFIHIFHGVAVRDIMHIILMCSPVPTNGRLPLRDQHPQNFSVRCLDQRSFLPKVSGCLPASFRGSDKLF